MYTMDVGLFLFDAVDHYVNSWGMIFLGFMECVSVGECQEILVPDWLITSHVTYIMCSDCSF